MELLAKMVESQNVAESNLSCQRSRAKFGSNCESVSVDQVFVLVPGSKLAHLPLDGPLHKLSVHREGQTLPQELSWSGGLQRSASLVAPRYLSRLRRLALLREDVADHSWMNSLATTSAAIREP